MVYWRYQVLKDGETMNRYELINALLDKDNKPEKKDSGLKTFLAVVGALALIGAAVYAVFRFLTPDYLKDLDSDFEDDFDDFFEEENEKAES